MRFVIVSLVILGAFSARARGHFAATSRRSHSLACSNIRTPKALDKRTLAGGQGLVGFYGAKLHLDASRGKRLVGLPVGFYNNFFFLGGYLGQVILNLALQPAFRAVTKSL